MGGADKILEWYKKNNLVGKMETSSMDDSGCNVGRNFHITTRFGSVLRCMLGGLFAVSGNVLCCISRDGIDFWVWQESILNMARDF